MAGVQNGHWVFHRKRKSTGYDGNACLVFRLKSLLFVPRIVVEFHLMLKLHLNTEELGKYCIISKIVNCSRTDNLMLKSTLSYRIILFEIHSQISQRFQQKFKDASRIRIWQSRVHIKPHVLRTHLLVDKYIHNHQKKDKIWWRAYVHESAYKKVECLIMKKTWQTADPNINI